MTHSIFVRDKPGFDAAPRGAEDSRFDHDKSGRAEAEHTELEGEKARTVLAHAIPSAGQAATIAGRIAASYPEYGHDPLTRVFWFRDRKGVHEIWAAPER